MLKLAVLGGRAQDGTILPRSEKELWRELKRVLESEVERISPLFPYVEFLIPLYSKFDIEFLRLIESYNRPVTFYVPSEDWGLSRLPRHQTALIERIDNSRIVIPSHTGRIHQMLDDADILYFLDNTKDVDYFKEKIASIKTIYFPEDEMRFKTEEEAEQYASNINQKSLNITEEETKELVNQYFS